MEAIITQEASQMTGFQKDGWTFQGNSSEEVNHMVNNLAEAQQRIFSASTKSFAAKTAITLGFIAGLVAIAAVADRYMSADDDKKKKEEDPK